MKTYLTVSVIGGLQGIILASYIFFKGKRKPAILMLSLYVFIFSAGLFENWVADNNNTVLSELVTSFLGNSSYLYGPFLYLFVFYLVNTVTLFRKKDLLHFLPFALFLLLDLIFRIPESKIAKRQEDVLELLQFELLVIQTITYNLLAIRKLKQHYTYILQTYSNIERRDLNWLKFFLILLTSIYCLSFLLSHLMLAGIAEIGNFFICLQIAITSCIYLMSYAVLSSPHLFVATEAVGYNIREELKEKSELQLPEAAERFEAYPLRDKYRKSGLKPELAAHYLDLLGQLMQNEKPYKNPDLTIQALSLQLGISKNHLTQVINEQLNMNFFEFINSHRIEEAKRLLLDPGYAHLSLLGIAADSGYKSKATFHSNFKKLTGHTPLEWLKENTGPLKA